MVIRPLNELRPEEKGRIIKVGGRGRMRQRLLDMGMVSGALVELKRVAPLGDPVQIRVMGYDLALRKEEAKNIQVELTVMPLSTASPGDTVEVVAVRAGWGLQRRLVGTPMPRFVHCSPGFERTSALLSASKQALRPTARGTTGALSSSPNGAIRSAIS